MTKKATLVNRKKSLNISLPEDLDPNHLLELRAKR
jgi:hypothetical protein